MPTYQYACTNADCGNRFELVQSFTDPSASDCPVCGSPVRKVYGSVGVVFKGSGFYRNDSRSESGAKAEGGKPETAKSDSGAKSDSKSDGGTKSENAGSAKSDTAPKTAGSTGSAKPSSGSATKAAAGS